MVVIRKKLPEIVDKSGKLSDRFWYFFKIRLIKLKMKWTLKLSLQIKKLPLGQVFYC
jgi:hypothetical protein